MHALGHPKQVVVSLRLHEAPRPDGQPMRQPQAGAPVFAENPASGEQPVGAVSSSTTSPMLGGEAIALGTVKFKHASPGTKLAVLADGTTLLPATVQPTLASWTRG
jgi:glycine cleavage system aminomethyltransferase T